MSDERTAGAAAELTCRELVGLVTGYLDGTLGAAERARFEAHLAVCVGCRRYLDQIAITVRSVGRLAEEDLPPDARDRLLSAFRGWRDGAASDER